MSRYIFDMEVGTKILREQNPGTKETQIILVNCICKLHVILILNIFYLLFSLINSNLFSFLKQNSNYESLISDIKKFSILTGWHPQILIIYHDIDFSQDLGPFSSYTRLLFLRLTLFL